MEDVDHLRRIASELLIIADRIEEARRELESAQPILRLLDGNISSSDSMKELLKVESSDDAKKRDN